jgi:RNA polymerase sigma factor (sigma-70 family)
MSDEESLADLMSRVRAGDELAAAELLRRYEAPLRRRVRVWLRMQDSRLRRVFDSVDICQSVLGSFFVRAASGQFDLEQPEQIVSLLVRIARNKLINTVGRHQALRRDVRRDEPIDEQTAPCDANQSPSQIASSKELLAEVRRRLDEDERAVADRRGQGVAWQEIAAELGGTAEGRRKQLSRALDRVAQELELD